MMNQGETDARVQDVLDDQATAEERVELSTELAENPEARRIYLDYVYLEIALEFARAEISPSSVGEVIPMEKVLARQKRKSFKVAVVAAVVACLIGAVALMLMKLPEPPLARFETSPQTDFTLSHVPVEGGETPEGNVMEVGSRLRLTKGALKLQLGEGIEAVVRAPADFILRGKSLVDFSHGTAWFEVSPKAVGFQVTTPEFLLTDLGTAFGISSKVDQPDEVHVFEGRVKVQRHQDETEVDLIEAQARRASGAADWEKIDFRPEAFFTSLPTVDLLPPHLYWSFEQIDGDGRLPTAGKLSVENPIEMRVFSENEGPEITQGRVGNAVQFDQAGDSLLTNWPGIAGDAPRSVAFWLKLPKNLHHYDARLMWWGRWSSDSSENSEWSLRATSYDYSNWATARMSWVDETRLQLYLGGSWWMGASALAPETWCHVAVCYGGAIDKNGKPIATLYLNGKEEKSRYQSAANAFGKPIDTILEPDSHFVIGRSRSSPGSSCAAALDELYVFDCELSPEAVRALANP